MRNNRRFILLIIIVVFAPFIVSALKKITVEYGTYVNARFQFEVKYPKALLAPLAPPDNNDGRTFESKDKKIKMFVWGQYNAIPNTWKEEYQQVFDGIKDARITYKSLKNKSFVISGYKGSRVFYRKEISVIEDDVEVFLSYMIEYPESDKTTWDVIVTTCADSLKMSKMRIPTDTNAFGLGTNADQFK